MEPMQKENSNQEGSKIEIVPGVLEIARTLFNKARETKGNDRLDSLYRLEKISGIYGPEQYQEVLRMLMTNQETIDELERSAYEK